MSRIVSGSGADVGRWRGHCRLTARVGNTRNVKILRCEKFRRLLYKKGNLAEDVKASISFG
jgi:hypothetical protein